MAGGHSGAYVVDFARQAGLTASTVTWPVMCASGAEYNIGEIWAPQEEDDPTPWFTRANSPAVEEIFEANKHMLRWMKTPQMDEFAASAPPTLSGPTAPT